MKNEFILFLVECPQTDNNSENAEAESIPEMIHVEHFSVENAASEHICNRIKRVCHKSHFDEFVADIELVNVVENRGQIEKKHTEYLIEILNILEENFKRAEDETDTYAEDKQNYNRNGGKENVAVDNGWLVRKEIEIDYETGKNGQRNEECHEVCDNIREGVYVFGNIHLFDDRCTESD